MQCVLRKLSNKGSPRISGAFGAQQQARDVSFWRQSGTRFRCCIQKDRIENEHISAVKNKIEVDSNLQKTFRNFCTILEKLAAPSSRSCARSCCIIPFPLVLSISPKPDATEGVHSRKEYGVNALGFVCTPWPFPRPD